MQASRRAAAVLLLIVLMCSGCDLLDDGPTARGAVEAPSPTIAAPPASPTVPATVALPATATAPITPTPTPTVPPTHDRAESKPRPAASGYRRFTSTRLPYAIDYLETWQPVAGARFDGGEGDLFSGAPAGSPASHVTVVSMPIATGTTPGLIFEAGLADLAEAGIRPVDEVERTVNGDEALVLSYSLSRDGQTVAVSQAIVVRPGTAWVLTLTTTPNDADRHVPVFNHMVDSFQVTA